MNISFNKPFMTGKELYYIAQAHFNGKLAGDGPFTKKCHAFLEKLTASPRVLLTHSCTAALEMQSLLLDISPEDEVIMPSFTFVSTANAVVLRGGRPVFIDIRPDTLNMDENLIEEAITPKTKAIAPVHYAGVGCEMDVIMRIAKKHDLKVIEDAAQAFFAFYKGKMLGSIGDLGAYSFHETKNIICGEGGALLVNNPDMIQQAEIIREKGTDRSRFFRGEIDKYTWQSPGSSFLPGEISAAFLFAQLEEVERIIQSRLESWNYYHELLKPLEDAGLIRRPVIPQECVHNAHLYYIIVSPDINRQKILDSLKARNVNAVFHYVPLHSSPGGLKYGRARRELPITESYSNRLIRLPLYNDISREEQEYVCQALKKALQD